MLFPLTVGWSSETESLLPGKLRLLDQTRLPAELTYLDMDQPEEIFSAIKRLVVRGAPAIGCAAALGLAAVSQHSQAATVSSFLAEVRRTADYLGSARPTAVNLMWALERCLKKLERASQAVSSVAELKGLLLKEGLSIVEEDKQLCRSIGTHGVSIFEGISGRGVLTHCNAGSLATAEFGTALAPIYVAHEQGLAPRVYADETRPLLQGARLTAWELQQAGVDVTLICDNMAGYMMQQGLVDLVIVGADRVAANGDAANKIGTYGVAVLAHYHQIPFYVAVPYSTIDMALGGGTQIPIEERDADEVRSLYGTATAPQNCKVHNPAFDVTPHELIAGIITEHGILRPPFDVSIRSFMQVRT